MKNSNTAITLIFLSVLLTACGGGGGGDTDTGDNSGGDNNRPTITGTPNTTVISNTQYQFLPSAQDTDGDTLLFSITNKPNWAIFDNTTGILAGTPASSAIGSYPNILISVSDGQDEASLAPFNITVASGSTTTDTDNDGLPDADEVGIYGTNPNVADTDGDGFLDKEEVDNWDQNSGTHLRFNPLVADVPRLLTRQLGAPVIQLYATTEESNSFSQGMSNENEDEVVTTTNRGRTNTNVVEEQHAVNVNAEVKKTGPIKSGKASASYDYQHTDTTTETNYWDKETVETNRQSVSEYYDTLNAETVTEKGGEIKIVLGLLNDGDISYTVNNMNVTAYIENPKKPGDLTAVGTLLFDGDMSFTPDPLGTSINPQDNDFTAFNFVYRADDNPEEISRILEQSNQLILKPVNISLTGQRSDVDLNLAAQNIRARTAEIIIDYGDNPSRKPERHRVAIDTGNGESLSFTELMNSHLNYPFEFSSASFPGIDGSRNGLTRLRDIEFNSNTNSYWLLAHTFTPANNSGGTPTTTIHNILSDSYTVDDIELRKGDVLHMVYIVDTDLDGLSDRLEVLKGTNIDLADTDTDGIDDAQEVYGWFSNLDTPPCESGENLSLLFSDPLLADTDGDGLSDGDERDNCTNPQGDLSVEAGDNQLADQATRVTLNAEPLNQQNGSALRYEWTQLEGVDVGTLPNRASIDIDVPDAVTSLRFEVTVTELDDEANTIATATDNVQVLVVRDQEFAVFIDPDAGHDFNNTGRTPTSPIRSIERAISDFTDNDLYLNNPNDGAVYALTETIVLSPESNLYGGFDDEWNHDPVNSKTPITVSQAIGINAEGFIEKTISGISIEAIAPMGGTEHSKAIFASSNGSDSQLRLDRISAQGSDLNLGTLSDTQIASYVAASSYGVFASQLSRLDIIDSTINAGKGANGYRGVTGANGRTGEAGVSRSGNDERGGGGGASHNGANGGSGGTAVTGALGCTAGKVGGKGGNSGSITGGSAGAAGKAVTSGFLGATCTLTSGGSGGSKSNTFATTGSQGIGATTVNTFITGHYLPSHGASGGQGSGGAGGGGGGSGGGRNGDNGGGGGGGGEGGEGGAGGKGGRGAGGSFAIGLYQIEFTDITNSTINTSTGGNGGAGGSGGSGGQGGAGGSGGDSGSRKGGSGGKGGWGGRGGSGGGGTGGPVAGILLFDSLGLEIEGSSITTANAGSGANPNRGQGGWNFGIYTDGSPYNLIDGNTFNLGLAGNDAPTADESNR